MEVVETVPNTFMFKPVPCAECDYRFACWTNKAHMCALKAMRIVKQYYGRGPQGGSSYFTVESTGSGGLVGWNLAALVSRSLVKECNAKNIKKS